MAGRWRRLAAQPEKPSTSAPLCLRRPASTQKQRAEALAGSFKRTGSRQEFFS
jgi:hypothetical protein